MRTRPTLTWEPPEDLPPATTDLRPVIDAVRAGGVVVLSGAGLSTESGIPDYRGELGSLRRGHVPMTYQDFTGSGEARQRYWARSQLGWRAMLRAEPNVGHRAVATLAQAGLVTSVITQNVDGLQQAAGVPDVIELHGSLSRVVCLHCGALSTRAELDRRLREANPDFEAAATRYRSALVNPDGDVDLPDEAVRAFVIVPCTVCGSGILKPDVVFFGENVPVDRVEMCSSRVAGASTLLVLGSSLTVMSGLRFVRQAAQAGTPVLIVNQGVTRGDRWAVRVELPLGEALRDVLAQV
ncbi:Sir2 family NAD-dependent protein deacetylase [Streptomyces sp. VRA16 Mangrove soil]|uniref:Sir2 family NAD-dependent protein deacetylase n=1 Tax=Streptomyces sp. VRA16 Mangrove soil TaxID=2817434 RepID=UPI001A9DE2BA|nr:Sir2 family NAD-dependent protein deacetylase [Streptomyces sp. VRA16 Mangrove soil]MBO1330762.1 NAD-dependent protein deacetylase 1 [Streptomyces sp. VRA16 Mangrove soil]